MPDLYARSVFLLLREIGALQRGKYGDFKKFLTRAARPNMAQCVVISACMRLYLPPKLHTMSNSIAHVHKKSGPEPIAFTRSELTRILNLYGYFVAAGDWRDYAIDHLSDAAVFSIFRRSSEAPLYRIEKRPAFAKKQGAWVVITMSGAVIKRGRDLAQVLKVFDRQKLRLAT